MSIRTDRYGGVQSRPRFSMRARGWFVLGVMLGLGLAVANLPRLPQLPGYHGLADQRNFLGVPHFLNVVSNAPLLLVGVAGLSFLFSRSAAQEADTWADPTETIPYAVFFTAVALTGLGSSYYHLAPDNLRLMWDRLPMALGFTALVAATISDHVNPKIGLRILLPLAAIGIGSVVYWQMGEAAGGGDLRLYGYVQYGSLAAILLVALLFSSRYTRSADLFGAAGIYALAKLAEVLDAPIYALANVVSGHTIKHVLAALSTYWILRMLRLRTMKAS